MQIHNYGDEAINNVKKFKEEWSISVRRGGFEWEDGGITLPEGWKKRRGQGKTESESILSPEGTQFRSRYNALMHLYKDNGSAKLIKMMRSKLSFEGWENNSLLPNNWLFKRTWEGVISNGSFSTNTVYLSSEGHVFESNKTAIDFMATNKKSYKMDNIDKIKEFQVIILNYYFLSYISHFILQVNLCKETTRKREDWIENESVPVSWKVRTSAGSSGKEYILRPDGQQFMSRINALQHLIKEGYDEADLRVMKNKLCYEGWTTSEYLPSGWLYKIICEGYTRDNKWYNTISYFSSEDELLESMKHVQEHMEKHPKYDENEPGNFVAVQINFKLHFTLDVVYHLEDLDDHSSHEWLMDTEYTKRLALKEQMYNTQFEDTFSLTEKGFDEKAIKFAQATLSNMIGGIGYFYGNSLVKSELIKEPTSYWSAPLYSGVPSRSFFPRGFLWDEGFHNLLISKWNPEISADIMAHWLDLMNSEGWIPREQILGPEARG